MNVQNYVAGGVFAKEWRAHRVGDYIEQHRHSFDHLSYLAVGSVEVEVEGKVSRYDAPTGINIRAHKNHKVTALTKDVLWLCIHAIPSELRDAEMIEKALIE